MTNNPTPQIPGLDINALGKMLGGMNLSGLSNMLGGMNLSGLSNMLSGVNITQLLPLVTQMMGGMKGLTSAAAPLIQNQGFGIQPHAAAPQGFGQLPVQQGPASLFPPIPEPYLNDPRVLVLNIMKPFLPPDKVRILDSIIGVMAVIFTVNTVLPKRSSIPATPTATPPVQPTATPVSTPIETITQPAQTTHNITLAPPPPPNAEISTN